MGMWFTIRQNRRDVGTKVVYVGFGWCWFVIVPGEMGNIPEGVWCPVPSTPGGLAGIATTDLSDSLRGTSSQWTLVGNVPLT